ncbi:MAG: hypothetical protein HY350_04775 [Candidatus Omnitrophica bacterium]|nr:hypothetical protein [Candidatus Omnitrophota bacterium]
MATLAKDASRTYEIGDLNEMPVIASDIVYEGAAVGENGSGYARPLVAGDPFKGFAERKIDNSTGAAGDLNVRLIKGGEIELSVSGAVITDVGQPVYASDDDTFTFVPTGNSFVGFVKRFVSSGKVMVAFNAGVLADPYGNAVRETVSADKTLDAEDSGKVFFVDTDAKVITLPAVEGMAGIKVVNIGAAGAVLVSISPNAADMIEGPDITAADNKDILNTKATAKRGDYVELEYSDANGWVIVDKKGIWAREA